jgi:hypothetical protein
MVMGVGAAPLRMADSAASRIRVAFSTNLLIYRRLIGSADANLRPIGGAYSPLE